MARKLTLGFLLVWIGIILVTAGWTLSAKAAVDMGLNGDIDWAGQVVRLHVVANSDTDEDQALKRAVRDAVLAEVTPLFAGAQTMDQAKERIAQAIPRIEQVAAQTIDQWQKAYPVRAEMAQVAFPGKAYGAVFLPAGEYTALRVLIGEAKGANWWCVLWPPLCFVDWSTGVVREPKPGSGGQETVTVPREELVLVAKEEPSSVKVQPRLAILEWLVGR